MQPAPLPPSSAPDAGAGFSSSANPQLSGGGGGASSGPLAGAALSQAVSSGSSHQELLAHVQRLLHANLSSAAQTQQQPLAPLQRRPLAHPLQPFLQGGTQEAAQQPPPIDAPTAFVSGETLAGGEGSAVAAPASSVRRRGEEGAFFAPLSARLASAGAGAVHALPALETHAAASAAAASSPVQPQQQTSSELLTEKIEALRQRMLKLERLKRERAGGGASVEGVSAPQHLLVGAAGGRATPNSDVVSLLNGFSGAAESCCASPPSPSPGAPQQPPLSAPAAEGVGVRQAQLQREGDAVQHLLECIRALRSQQVAPSSPPSPSLPPLGAKSGDAAGENASFQQRLVNFLAYQHRQQQRLIQALALPRAGQELPAEIERRNREIQEHQAKLLALRMRLLQQGAVGETHLQLLRQAREAAEALQQRASAIAAAGAGAAADPQQLLSRLAQHCALRQGTPNSAVAAAASPFLRSEAHQSLQADAALAGGCESSSAAAAEVGSSAAALEGEVPDSEKETQRALRGLRPLLRASFRLPHFLGAAARLEERRRAAAAAAAAGHEALVKKEKDKEDSDGVHAAEAEQSAADDDATAAASGAAVLGESLLGCLAEEGGGCTSASACSGGSVGLGLPEWQRDCSFLFFELSRLSRLLRGLPPDALVDHLLRVDSTTGTATNGNSNGSSSPPPAKTPAAATEEETPQRQTQTHAPSPSSLGEEDAGSASPERSARETPDVAGGAAAANVLSEEELLAAADAEGVASAARKAPSVLRGESPSSQDEKTPPPTGEYPPEDDAVQSCETNGDAIPRCCEAPPPPAGGGEAVASPSEEEGRFSSGERSSSSDASPDMQTQQDHDAGTAVAGGESSASPQRTPSAAAAQEGSPPARGESGGSSISCSGKGRPAVSVWVKEWMDSAEGKTVADQLRAARREREALEDAASNPCVELRHFPMEFSRSLSAVCLKALQQVDAQQQTMHSAAVLACFDRVQAAMQPLWAAAVESASSSSAAGGRHSSRGEGSSASDGGGSPPSPAEDEEEPQVCVLCRVVEQQHSGAAQSQQALGVYAAGAGGANSFLEALDAVREKHVHVFTSASRAPLPVLDDEEDRLSSGASRGGHSQQQQPTGGVGGVSLRAASSRRRQEPPSSLVAAAGAGIEGCAAEERRREAVLALWKQRLRDRAQDAVSAFECGAPRKRPLAAAEEGASETEETQNSSSVADALLAAAALGEAQCEALAKQFILGKFGVAALEGVALGRAPVQAVSYDSFAWRTTPSDEEEENAAASGASEQEEGKLQGEAVAGSVKSESPLLRAAIKTTPAEEAREAQQPPSIEAGSACPVAEASVVVKAEDVSAQATQQQQLAEQPATTVEETSPPPVPEPPFAGAGEGVEVAEEKRQPRVFSVRRFGHFCACCLALDALEERREAEAATPGRSKKSRLSGAGREADSYPPSGSSGLDWSVRFSALLCRLKKAADARRFCEFWAPVLAAADTNGGGASRERERDGLSRGASGCRAESGEAAPFRASETSVMTVSAQAIRDVTADCREWLRRRVCLERKTNGEPASLREGGCRCAAAAPGEEEVLAASGCAEPNCYRAFKRKADALGFYSRSRQVLLLDAPPWTSDVKLHPNGGRGLPAGEERSSTPGYSLRQRRRCPPSPNASLPRTHSSLHSQGGGEEAATARAPPPYL